MKFFIPTDYSSISAVDIRSSHMLLYNTEKFIRTESSGEFITEPRKAHMTPWTIV